MNRSLFDKYMSSASFFRSPEEGGAPPSLTAPAGGSNPATPGASPTDGGATDSGSDVSFENVGSGDDFDSVDLGDTESVPDATPSDVPAVTPPVVVPPAAVPAPVAPAVAAPAAPTAPTGNEGPTSELDSMLTNLQTNAPALEQWLTENSFKLSKEEQDAFELDAVGQIPKMMAKVQVASMKMALNLMKNLVPQLIDQRVTSTSAKSAKAQEAINEFYTTNADLNAKDHSALVDKWSRAFRANNPTASRQDAIKFVGNAIRTELGMAAPVAPAGRPQPFAPARPGARPSGPVPKAVEQPFAALGMDFDET